MNLAEQRYELIAPLLAKYKRRFTLLDLGAGINPYLGQRVSNEFDCCYVAIEQDEISTEELAKFGPRAMWLRKKMSAEDLERLACCEHFDVVLAFNILHHFGEDWTKAMGAIDLMSDWVIVQTPYFSDLGTCGTEVTGPIHEAMLMQGRLIGATVNFDNHCPRPIFEVGSNVGGWLSMSSWTSPEDCILAEIFSNYEYKSIDLHHKEPQPSRAFIHGLNLWSFAQLNGQWPSKDKVLQLIKDFPIPGDHGDITPHNFLFDGQELHLIDGHEGWEFDDREGLKKAEEMMAEVLR